jgi:hypothetical protein
MRRHSVDDLKTDSRGAGSRELRRPDPLMLRKIANARHGRRHKIRRKGHRPRPTRAILPAGTGHQCLGASRDFLVIGAYPPAGIYDECAKPEQHARALKTIPNVPRPRKDPVYGADGALLTVWKSKK